MKKNEYMTPEMEIVEIKTEHFIANSPTDEKGPSTDWEDGGDGTVD